MDFWPRYKTVDLNREDDGSTVIVACERAAEEMGLELKVVDHCREKISLTDDGAELQSAYDSSSVEVQRWGLSYFRISEIRKNKPTRLVMIRTGLIDGYLAPLEETLEFLTKVGRHLAN